MLKKGLLILLTLVMLLGVIAVLPLSASAHEIEINKEAADREIVEDGTEADIAEDGFDKDIANQGDGSTQNWSLSLSVGQTKTFTRTISSTRFEWYSMKEEVVGDNTIFAYSYGGSGNQLSIVFVGVKPGQATLRETWKGYDHGNNWNVTSYDNIVVTVTGSSSSSSSSSSSTNLSTPKMTGKENLDSGMKVKWNAVSGAAKYRVYKKVSGSWKKLGDTTSTSYVDKNVKSGGSYTYTVRCINAAGTKFTSGYNKTGWNYTYNMATPKITSVVSSSSGAKITWGAVTNAKKYRVYYKNGKSWTKLGDTASTSITDTKVAFGATRTYTVRCLKSDGSRFTSAYNTTGWKHTHYLKTPKISGCESTTSGVKVKWSAVTGAVKYRVYRKNSGKWTKLGDTTSTSFTDKTAVSGKSYTYTVRCINSANTFTSAYDTVGYTYTYHLNLATPHITKCETVSSGVKVTWGAVSGAPLYRLYYKSSTGWKKIKDTKDTSYVDTGVVYGNTYTYTVRCLSADGKTFISSYDSTGKTHDYEEAPKIWSIYSDNDEKIHIEWSTYQSKADKYYIYRKANGSWTRIGEARNGWWDDNNVVRGSSYTYTVRAVNKDGSFISYYNTTGWSCSVSTLPVDNRKIKSMMLSDTGTLWFDTEGEITSSYTELLVKDGATWKSLGYSFNSPYSENNLKNTGLVTGKPYTFTIRGVDSNGKAQYAYNTTGATLTLLEEPQNFDDEIIDGNKVRFSWDPVVGASYYILYIKDIDNTIKITENSYVADYSSYDRDLWEARLYAVGSNGVVKSDSVPNYFWNKNNN